MRIQKHAGHSFIFPDVEPVLQALRKNLLKINISGLHGSAKAWYVAGIIHSIDRPILITQPTPEQAGSFFKDLRCWLEWMGPLKSVSSYFPDIDDAPDQKLPPDPERLSQRLRSLYGFIQGSHSVMVAPSIALTQPVPDRETFLKNILRIGKGRTFDREAIMAHCIETGYRRVELVDQPGEFAVRGGLLDLFSPASQDPVRMEWVGDTVESMRRFDAETQLSKAEIQELVILPLLGKPSDPVDTGPNLLTDYFPPETVLIIEDPESCIDRLEHYAQENPEGTAARPEETSPEQIIYPQRFQSFVCMRDLRMAGVDSIHDRSVEFSTRSPESLGLGLTGTPLGKALDILQDLRGRSRVMLVAKSLTQQDRIIELFLDHDLPAVKLLSADSKSGDLNSSPQKTWPFLIAVGELSFGFCSPESSLAVFTDEDLFGKIAHQRPPARPKAGRFISSLEDLRKSDYVVHLHHGIGQYQGIRRLTIGGLDSDFLLIRYLGGDILYVPIDHLHLVQKFIGVESRSPKLDRLGGWTWARTTKRVKKAVEEITKELLELYAQREACSGTSFSSDDHLSKEFDTAFEYEETPHQLKAINEVLQDMERTRPMDRLVCGDVGYGKTEVAMRAAFKAVKDNFQVAVLVPTTLLAHQHYQTFHQRFSPFPVRISMLSRFTTPQEQKRILKDLATGKVDILIGTLRVLQKDVSFYNLGLLVVDEEQRFGVNHKEKLKQLKKSIDVLTLTATPIPRTLQMSLVGIRDLSTIETPLPDRLAVGTVLSNFDRQVIRSAILRELERGGQVFFVHNRIENILEIGRYLKQLVPEIKMGIAHGQMRGRQLESVMMKFVQKEYNLLLSTAIIESGLDIPSANTILINNAHQFGLSDLYQLRGRVGRSSQQGYAYLLVPSGRNLTGEAKSRLSALQEFCELGAGFRIAAKDLEIRGAGHLLGQKQSGHVASVGFEYFLQLIEKAVLKFKGIAEEESIDPTMDIPVSAFIPEDYIPEVHHRLSIYRRLSDLFNEAGLSTLISEIEDRYGPPPMPLIRLLEVVRLKILAKELKIIKLSSAPDGVTLTFSPTHKLSDQQFEQLIASQSDLQFISEFSLKLPLHSDSWSETYQKTRKSLQKLLQYDTRRLG